MKHIFKKVSALFLAAVLLLSLIMTACASDPPALAEVQDEFIGLIEASYTINDIFFGDGLPSHDRDGEYAKESNMYYGLVGYDDYEYVAEDSPFFFVEDIRAAAAAVYSEEYLEAISTMAFTGYADTDSGVVTTARYLEVDGVLLKYAYGDTDSFNILPGHRRYDFSTMEMVEPSYGDSVNIRLDSYLLEEQDGTSASKQSVTLRFVLEENGWRLDTPTY